MDTGIAEIIGGDEFLRDTGATEIIDTADALSFDVPRGVFFRGITRVEITRQDHLYHLQLHSAGGSRIDVTELSSDRPGKLREVIDSLRRKPADRSK